jgi:hypothetical protein
MNNIFDDFLRRHYPHQVKGRSRMLPLSLSNKLPCFSKLYAKIKKMHVAIRRRYFL